jgi:hypothetical protein
MKPMTETLGEKLIRCGWVTNFNVKTLVKLIEEHFSSRTSSAPTPISLKERHPEPEDCDGSYCWFFNEPDTVWEFLFWGNMNFDTPDHGFTHWLPYYAIQIPTYTKTPND